MTDDLKAAAMADRAYIAGMQFGYKLGLEGDEKQYQAVVESRLQQKRDAKAPATHEASGKRIDGLQEALENIADYEGVQGAKIELQRRIKSPLPLTTEHGQGQKL